MRLTLSFMRNVLKIKLMESLKTKGICLVKRKLIFTSYALGFIFFAKLVLAIVNKKGYPYFWCDDLVRICNKN